MQVCPPGFGSMNVQVEGFHCYILRPMERSETVIFHIITVEKDCFN